SPTYHDEVTHSSRTAEMAGLELGEFNTFEFRWHADRVEWFVNGKLLRTAEVAVPTKASPVRFNLWAAGAGWAEAYGKDLQPTKEPGATATYEIDWVEVRAVVGGSE
ncbi:MAG: family 16 glycosylhydrolase, partial [Planctomycetota bacterium]